LPQLPQFCGSVCALTQLPLPQVNWPELQPAVAVIGLAQPTTKSAKASAARQAKRDVERENIWTPYGGSER
jgi:hypothetical protein